MRIEITRKLDLFVKDNRVLLPPDIPNDTRGNALASPLDTLLNYSDTRSFVWSLE